MVPSARSLHRCLSSSHIPRHRGADGFLVHALIPDNDIPRCSCSGRDIHNLSLFKSDRFQPQTGRLDSDNRRCGRSHFHIHGFQIRSRASIGYSRGRILVHSAHTGSTTDSLESPDHKRRENDKNGSAKARFETGKGPVSDIHNIDSRCARPKGASARWYADVR